MNVLKLVRNGARPLAVLVFAAVAVIGATAAWGMPGKGEKAPDFSLTDLSGKQANLKDYRCKVVMINFWATWCPPCRDEMPSMERLYKTYRDKGFVLVAVSADRGGKMPVQSFVDEYNLTFPILLDPSLDAARKFGVRGIPMTFIVNGDGVIKEIVPGAKDWDSAANRKTVEDLLKTGTCAQKGGVDGKRS
jgi:peroxiredoxin